MPELVFWAARVRVQAWFRGRGMATLKPKASLHSSPVDPPWRASGNPCIPKLVTAAIVYDLPEASNSLRTRRRVRTRAKVRETRADTFSILMSASTKPDNPIAR